MCFKYMYMCKAGSLATDHDAAERFRKALAARDVVEARLESELAAAKAQAASYEYRCERLMMP